MISLEPRAKPMTYAYEACSVAARALRPSGTSRTAAAETSGRRERNWRLSKVSGGPYATKHPTARTLACGCRSRPATSGFGAVAAQSRSLAALPIRTRRGGPGYGPAVHAVSQHRRIDCVRPKLLDLEYANMRRDLRRRPPRQESVLATGPRPERVKCLSGEDHLVLKRATTSTPPTGYSGYVFCPFRGVSAGHCTFSADTPT
jgi:hypothetical protein